MKIPDHCPFCEKKLIIYNNELDTGSQIFCISCESRPYYFSIWTKDLKITNIILIVDELKLHILPLSKGMFLSKNTNGAFENLAILPISHIDLSSKEDIINKINLLLTFI